MRMLFVVFLAGCAGFSPTVGKDEKPTGKEAFLYGRFYMNAPAMRLTAQGHQRMGFTLQCADQQTYTIKFDRDEPLQVLKIAPASCALSEIIGSDADGFVRTRKPAPPAMTKSTAYEAGKAYYLGDFSAEGRQIPGVTVVQWTWRITNVTNDYRNTTDKLKIAYPNLAGIPTENRMIGR
jgi:hypothetical protein